MDGVCMFVILLTKPFYLTGHSGQFALLSHTLVIILVLSTAVSDAMPPDRRDHAHPADPVTTADDPIFLWPLLKFFAD